MIAAITRAWLAFAAIGAAPIHFALVMNAPFALGLVLSALAVLEFGWGVVTFAREDVVVPRTAMVVAIVPVTLWGVALAVGTLAGLSDLAAALPFVPLAVTSTLGLFIAAVLGVHLRRRGDGAAPPAAPGLGRYVVGLAVGVLVVVGLATPALAAAIAEQAAPPSGESNEFDVPDHTGGH